MIEGNACPGSGFAGSTVRGSGAVRDGAFWEAGVEVDLLGAEGMGAIKVLLGSDIYAIILNASATRRIITPR